MNVLIIDDHEILKEGIERRVLEVLPNATCFFASNLRCVIRFLTEKRIDLAICDLEFNNNEKTTGFTIVESILQFKPHTKLIAHTNYNSYRVMNKAIESGFQSFIYKGAPFSEFSDVITNVLKDNQVYESNTMKNLRKERKQFIRSIFSDSLYGISSLSEREAHLVLLAKETINRQELSKIMRVKATTIDTYFKRIIDKLHLNDRKEIAMFSYEFSDEIKKVMD